MAIRVNQPLPLEGTCNTRELGGYPTSLGGLTKDHVFLRSDALNDLTVSDQKYLYNYGVRLVVDLRSTAEATAAPDKLGDMDVRYVHIPLLDGVQSALANHETLANLPRVPSTLGMIYVLIVELEKPNICRALRELIDCPDCALFHCTSGKDRTGIIAMFLLEMVGVPEKVIVADYSTSARNMEPKLAEDRKIAEKLGPQMIPPDAFESKPEFMTSLLMCLKKKYGSPVAYLKDAGLKDEEIEKLRSKFVMAAAESKAD